MLRGVLLTALMSLGVGVLIWVIIAVKGVDDLQLRAGDRRVCNTVLNVPDDVSLEPFVGDHATYPGGPPLFVEAMWVELPYDGAAALLDPATGEVLRRVDGEDQQRLDEVLSTKRVTPATGLTATWPYSEHVLTPPVRGRSGRFEHRYPDQGSGLVSLGWGSFGGYSGMAIANCRSIMLIYVDLGEDSLQVDDRNVHPRDRSAFRTFLREVRLLPPYATE